MGDLRYYTYSQFFSIIFFTILIAFMVLVLCYSFFRFPKTKDNRFIIFQMFLVLVYGILKFIEEVHMNLALCEALRLAQISIYMILLIFIIIAFMAMNAQNKTSWVYYFIGVGISILVFIGVTIFHKAFIVSYQFNYIRYGLIYLIMLILLEVIMLVLYVFLRNHYLKRRDNIRTKIITWGVFLIVFIPNLIYLMGVYYQWQVSRYFEVVLLIVIDIIYLSTLGVKSTTSIVPFMFEKVLDEIDNMVFVLDNKGQIIFNNRDKHIDIQAFLKNPHIQPIDEHWLTEHSRIDDDGETYQYMVENKPLFKEERFIGHILTFINITELKALLHEQEAKEHEARMINKQLHRYKETVYDFEKEQEINKLLEIIIKEQSKSMNQMIAQINKMLDVEVESPEELDALIRACQNNLDHVRKAVSTYRAHQTKEASYD